MEDYNQFTTDNFIAVLVGMVDYYSNSGGTVTTYSKSYDSKTGILTISLPLVKVSSVKYYVQADIYFTRY